MSAEPHLSSTQAGQVHGGAKVQAVLSPQERLNRSRQHMSRWLIEQGSGAGPGTHPDPGRPPGAATGLRGLFGHPLALVGLDLLTQWWAQHPLLRSARKAEDSARGVIAPLVRRHPVAVLGTAAAAGALLVWWRPWRWLPRPAKLAGMASNITLGAIS